MVEANTVFQLLGSLAKSAKEVQISRNHQLIYKTDEAREIFCITKGLVRQFLPGDHGGIQGIEDLEPYSMFGHEAALNDSYHHLSAIALVDSTLLVVSSLDLKQQIMKYPEFGIELLRIIAVSQRLAYKRVEEISLSRGRHKLNQKP